MKVLFALNNDNVSNAIIKKYQKDYKEIISYKNVYYFNAILKELQQDKSYDRVVISEELEPFANNNYDTIDKFLFEKLDKISDEATKTNGEDIAIIFICSDRRNNSDEMLNKIFGIGIYNALVGDERDIDNVCKLIKQPRTKKEAKFSYKLDGTNISYQAEDENNVSEAEVQNILAHYKRLGKDEDKYVDSFNNIVSQYTDAQLRIIIRYLPIGVKAVLEEKSPKYQQLATFTIKNKTEQRGSYISKTIGIKTSSEEKIKVKMLKDEKDKITKPIVIPTTLNNKKTVIKSQINKLEDKIKEDVESKEENIQALQEERRGRGRPRKNTVQDEIEDKQKKGRGRPKKNIEPETEVDNEEKFDIDLFNMDSIEDNNNNITSEIAEDIDLFSMAEDETEEVKEEFKQLDNAIQNDNIDLFSMDKEKTDIDLFNMPENEDNNIQNTYVEPTVKLKTDNLNTALTSKKKIVTFVGTTKNGTSFIVNNLALVLSSMNISTAILDITKSKNAYYIYTKNEENLREIAEKSISNLENGNTNGIEVNKNLTVYTELPGTGLNTENVDAILTTLIEKHDIVLIDADFDTPIDYFDKSQEIYLVQTMDILTIQPLTAFLRNLKSKNVLMQNKLKIVINKEQKVRTLSDKILIGGMSSYNDPSMSFMTELFDKDNIQYCKIPFETQNYVRYLESLVNCNISLKGYTKNLLMALKVLSEMVYPLLGRTKYTPMGNQKNKNRMSFSDSTNSTLNKMKNNY